MAAATYSASSSRHRSTLCCALAAAVWLAGCGADDGEDALRNVGSCGTPWQPLFTQSDGLEPYSLALTEEALWFRTYEGTAGQPNVGRSFIKSLSLTDGVLRTLVEDEAELLWVEGDTLLYSHLASADSLFSVPLAGGAPELVVDGGHDVAGSEGFATGLDARHLYWVDPVDASDGNFSIWRVPRAGGTAERFAVLAELDRTTRLWLGPDAVIAANAGKSLVLPLDGAPARPLAEVTSLASGLPLGIDALGTYWARASSGAGRSRAPVDIVRAPATGGAAEVFWASKPEGFEPSRVSPDGQSGWVVSGTEVFDDGQSHYELWFVDAEGGARLAACNPSPQTTGNLAAPVLSAEAAYQLVRQAGEPATWSLVKVARP